MKRRSVLRSSLVLAAAGIRVAGQRCERGTQPPGAAPNPLGLTASRPAAPAESVVLGCQARPMIERVREPLIAGITTHDDAGFAQAYGENLEEKLKDLHDRVHKGSYRAQPARRTYIPKPDGSKRPLSILCLEDKVVQQAIVFVLEA
jgi:hypothetical protein